jgi:DNA-binding NarL/FixJ family response regulator
MPASTASSAASSIKPSGKKRLMIIDDHPVFRAGMKALANAEPDLCICAEAHDAAHALQIIEAAKPDLLLVDMNLPGKNGLELLKDVRALYPKLPVMVLSMHDEASYAERVIRAGGRGYVMKHERPEQILDSIRKVLSGGIALSESMATVILDSLSNASSAKPGPTSVSLLTDREFEIYRHIGEGKEPHEIAQLLHLSIKTVDTHRGHIKQKLHLRNGTELIHHATRWVAGEITQP